MSFLKKLLENMLCQNREIKRERKMRKEKVHIHKVNGIPRRMMIELFRKTSVYQTGSSQGTRVNRRYQEHVSKSKMKLTDKKMLGCPEMQFTLKLKAWE